MREDDALELRGLIESYGVTPNNLSRALAATITEFDAEHKRWFPLKNRLREAPDTELVITTTQTATEQVKNLQRELESVQTDLIEIDENIHSAESTVSTVQQTLEALTQRGWDVSSYEQRATALADAVVAARAKRAENYLDEPTKVAKATTDEASKLQEEADALESRRTAADEAYNTQTGRLTDAKATAETIRGRYTKLQETYNLACLVDFENLQGELAQSLAALASTHETGGNLTDKQGMSVESVSRSEELNASFDETAEKIQVMEANVRKRDEHLVLLVAQLPRKVSNLSALFDRAMNLADDPDVEDEAAAEIKSLADDVANLAASISTVDGKKPDYLDVEQRHVSLAEEVKQARNTAAQQKQEMNDLRTNVPQLAATYNQLVTVIKTFADNPKVRLHDKTQNSIAGLKDYQLELATDRKGLRQQHGTLKEHVKYTRSLIKQAEKESNEDGLLLKTAKIAGGIALIALIGSDGDIFD